MGEEGDSPSPLFTYPSPSPASSSLTSPLLYLSSLSRPSFPIPLSSPSFPPYPLSSFSLFLRSPSPFLPSLPTSGGEFSPREVCAVEPLDARVERLRGGRWERCEGVLWVIFYTFVRLCTEYKWYRGKDLQPRNTGAYADQSLTFPPLKQDAIHGVLAMASG